MHTQFAGGADGECEGTQLCAHVAPAIQPSTIKASLVVKLSNQAHS